MSNPSERLQSLAYEFDALAKSLGALPRLKERKQLLQRMKILIDEIDVLILSDLERDKQDATARRPGPTNPQSGPEKSSPQNTVGRWK